MTVDGYVHEGDEPHTGPYGNVEHMGVRGRLEPATRMYATLPRETPDGNRMPFVLYLGWTTNVELLADRPELERLRTLIDRALEQDSARDDRGRGMKP